MARPCQPRRRDCSCIKLDFAVITSLLRGRMASQGMLAPVTVPGHAAEAVSRQPGVVAVTQRGSETPLSLLAGGYLMSDITATTLWVSCGHISPARRRFGHAASAPDRRTLTARRSSRRLREWRLHSLDLSRGKVPRVM